MRDFIHTSVAATICLFSFLITALTPTASAQYIGTIDTVGTTWYDYQHNGTAGRMIRVDVNGNIHVCWTNGLEAWAAQRHVYYNHRYLSYGWSFGSQGVSVESMYRAGFCNVDVDSSGRPYIIFTGYDNLGDPPHIVLAYDLFPGAGAFAIDDLPPPPPDVEGLMHPKIAIDINGRIHVIAHEYGSPGPAFRIFYCQDEYSEWFPVAWTTASATDINTSRHSDRVAIVYTDIRDDNPDTTQYNNDIYLIVSEDGINWEFENPINVTDFIPPDSTGHNCDTLRAYTDASIIFDSDDNIHVAFTTPGYYPSTGLVSVSNSLIWHWSELTEYYSLVADGWVEPAATCGAWQRYVQRPCLARDETTGDLFITYQQHDTSDIAANGFPQADAMISRSTDGIRWSMGTNVTNTHAPGGNAGECMHERDITCNETVENDTLYIFYILDKDAGSVIQSEGTWTENLAICQFVPIDQIPTTPLMPIYPLHIDSTGMPPVDSVEPANNDNIPTIFALHQNYPNPFNPSTTIQFDLISTEHVTLKIYNTLGREITTLVDANLTPGTYKVPFTAENLSSGIYFYTLTSSTITKTQKMVLLK